MFNKILTIINKLTLIKKTLINLKKNSCGEYELKKLLDKNKRNCN